MIVNFEKYNNKTIKHQKKYIQKIFKNMSENLYKDTQIVKEQHDEKNKKISKQKAKFKKYTYNDIKNDYVQYINTNSPFLTDQDALINKDLSINNIYNQFKYEIKPKQKKNNKSYKRKLHRIKNQLANTAQYNKSNNYKTGTMNTTNCPEIAHTEAAHTEAAHTEAAHTEAAHTEAAHTEAAHHNIDYLSDYELIDVDESIDKSIDESIHNRHMDSYVDIDGYVVYE
jgi:hypothetical protein